MSEKLQISGKTISLDDIDQIEGTAIAGFLKEWTNSKDHVIGHTSGSTGKPKEIELRKESMRKSAEKTNKHFGLKKDDKILLCLKTDYIAGKMIVIRALVGGLNLICTEVTSCPKWEGDITFAAMVPMQVETLLHDKEGRERLKRIKTLIIGGGPVSKETREKLIELDGPKCYVTYGMTETLSHVAVAEIGDKEYKALEGIEFGTDDRGCLTIEAKHIQQEPFVTNDVVELADIHTFVWKGRWDNVINSGGIKLFPEEIEKKLSGITKQRFYITSKPDTLLGEKTVMMVEGERWSEAEENEMAEQMKKRLDKYEIPKEIIFMSKFEETRTGKIVRRRD